MRDGWIKVAAASPQIKVADCAYNTDSIKKAMKKAEEEKVKLLVLPELCITGYTCNDLFLQTTLEEQALAALEELVAFSHAVNVLTVVGLPMRWKHKLYNCAAVLYKGKLLGVVPKTHLPNYGEFYEHRHFVPAPAQNERMPWGETDVPFGTKLLFACREMPAFVLGIEICEDLWVPNPPSIAHAMAGATVLANLSASDEVTGKDVFRRQLVISQSAKLVGAICMRMPERENPPRIWCFPDTI
jgi:NAD+ synthase (glutamine-hydrolysing)